MRIFLAANLNKSWYLDLLFQAQQKNILYTYHGMDIKNKDELLDRAGGKNIIIDSGAFSAWTKKIIIDIDQYIALCKELFLSRKENMYFVNLDVIPGDFGRKPTKDEIEKSAQKGWNNMEHMENNGIKCIHVFHQHEDFKWLDKLVKHQEYIGISPANDVTKQQRMVWLDQVFGRIKNTVKTHGFGATAQEIIHRYPWFSVDSTSWKAPAVWGTSCTCDLEKLGFKKTPGKLMVHELIPEIKRWQQIEREATFLWKKRGVIWET